MSIESLVFVGTYTETEGSQSEGIYVYRMDVSSGKLTFERVVKGVLNPSFLVIHPQQSYLYAVNEVQKYDGQPGGGVSGFPIHAIDPSGTFLLVANQKTNNIVTFKIDAESGGLSRTEHEVTVSRPACLKFASL